MRPDHARISRIAAPRLSPARSHRTDARPSSCSGRCWRIVDARGARRGCGYRRHLEEAVRGEGRAALRDEDETRSRVLLPEKLAKCPDLDPAEQLHAVVTALASDDLHPASSEVHLLPAQRHKLADAQTMSISHQDHRRVPVPQRPRARAASQSWLTSFSVRYSRRGVLVRSCRVGECNDCLAFGVRRRLAAQLARRRLLISSSPTVSKPATSGTVVLSLTVIKNDRA
jgi:hypothetical protein